MSRKSWGEETEQERTKIHFSLPCQLCLVPDVLCHLRDHQPTGPKRRGGRPSFYRTLQHRLSFHMPPSLGCSEPQTQKLFCFRDFFFLLPLFLELAYLSSLVFFKQLGHFCYPYNLYRRKDGGGAGKESDIYSHSSLRRLDTASSELLVKQTCNIGAIMTLTLSLSLSLILVLSTRLSIFFYSSIFDIFNAWQFAKQPLLLFHYLPSM